MMKTIEFILYLIFLSLNIFSSNLSFPEISIIDNFSDTIIKTDSIHFDIKIIFPPDGPDSFYITINKYYLDYQNQAIKPCNMSISPEEYHKGKKILVTRHKDTLVIKDFVLTTRIIGHRYKNEKYDFYKNKIDSLSAINKRRLKKKEKLMVQINILDFQRKLYSGTFEQIPIIGKYKLKISINTELLNKCRKNCYSKFVFSKDIFLK